jgi:hypothetical protein
MMLVCVASARSLRRGPRHFDRSKEAAIFGGLAAEYEALLPTSHERLP